MDKFAPLSDPTFNRLIDLPKKAIWDDENDPVTTYRQYVDPSHPEFANSGFFDHCDEVSAQTILWNLALNHAALCDRFNVAEYAYDTLDDDAEYVFAKLRELGINWYYTDLECELEGFGSPWNHGIPTDKPGLVAFYNDLFDCETDEASADVLQDFVRQELDELVKRYGHGGKTLHQFDPKLLREIIACHLFSSYDEADASELYVESGDWDYLIADAQKGAA